MTDQISLLVGWREWAALPMLDIPLIKIKIDTGAKTSALHAYDLEIVETNDKKVAHFFIHPIQKNDLISVKAIADIIDMRVVKSSNGHTEQRPVIKSNIKIGNYVWDIEITLTQRDIMLHRMILGREAMKSVLIDPKKSYCQGRVSLKNAKLRYTNHHG